MLEVAHIAKSFTPNALLPFMPDPREFSTNELMGQSGDRLAVAMGVSR